MPRAEIAKGRLQVGSKESGTQETEGAGNSPLMGDSGYPWPNTPPPKGQGSGAEARGRPGGEKGRKRALIALDEWPPDPTPPGKGPSKRKPAKRLQGTPCRKGNKEAGTGGRGQVALLRQWLETGKGGLGPRKE